MHESEAVRIAQGFLKTQKLTRLFFVDSPRVVEESTVWAIYFKRKKPMRPNECAISVDKKTGKAALIPLR